jgi:hypothetical protein
VSLREERLRAQIRELQARNFELEQKSRREEEAEPLRGYEAVAAYCARRAREKAAKAAKAQIQKEDEQ